MVRASMEMYLEQLLFAEWRSSVSANSQRTGDNQLPQYGDTNRYGLVCACWIIKILWHEFTIIQSNFIINYIHQSRPVTLHDIVIILFRSKAISVKALTNELFHPWWPERARARLSCSRNSPGPEDTSWDGQPEEPRKIKVTKQQKWRKHEDHLALDKTW